MGKYNEDIVNTICKNLEDGLTKKDAAIMSGIDEKTFYRWMNGEGITPEQQVSFASKVELSLAKYRAKLIKIINAHTIRDWRPAIEVLERRFSKDWGKKQTLEVINPESEIKKIMDLLKDHDDTNKSQPKLLPERS